MSTLIWKKKTKMKVKTSTTRNLVQQLCQSAFQTIWTIWQSGPVGGRHVVKLRRPSLTKDHGESERPQLAPGNSLLPVDTLFFNPQSTLTLFVRCLHLCIGARQQYNESYDESMTSCSLLVVVVHSHRELIHDESDSCLICERAT
ncbi:hypothetical protein CDV31_016303 [Fusarium ambrosium]|uniref:Uncharacterized protein n=1 Tax=Fusarium ambrosium TaxID=131363 RepID=A0A428SBJ6_9HYPO|nr:hypothetical protein CDV31_016303 [Fusarium ambrosium]